MLIPYDLLHYLDHRTPLNYFHLQDQKVVPSLPFRLKTPCFKIFQQWPTSLSTLLHIYTALLHLCPVVITVKGEGLAQHSPHTQKAHSSTASANGGIISPFVSSLPGKPSASFLPSAFNIPPFSIFEDVTS